MNEVDKVRKAYLHDPSVAQEEYARLIEAADETDRAREAAAELSDNDEEGHMLDPDKCLSKIRRLMDAVLDQDLGGDADALATQVEALDEYLCKGGRFPDVWTRGINREEDA